ncbi:MAG: hypothetical protein APF84_10460 [Gracilibacter sp. BRH_c7a]|nr:MAG: hypothetical protein APF84_10460 [Gracilibacter sp. BRH_c7a]
MDTLNTYYESREDLITFVKEYHDILFNNQPTVLVQVFSGICEKEFIQRLTAEISELVPHAKIIGTTTAGEIMNGQVSEIKIVISFAMFYHTETRHKLFFKEKAQNDFELGQSIASSLCSDRTKVLILFATGLTINANQLLKGVQSINPSLPIAGGNAGDNSLMQQSFVFCNDYITDYGVVGTVLEGDHLTVNCHWHLGWQPIGNEMTITKADELRVYTIDNLPAFKIYEKYLGLNNARLLDNHQEYPLISYRHGVQMARIPVIHYDDGSLGFLADVIEGEKVWFSYGHVGTILHQIDNLSRQIKQHPAESIFVYSCVSRKGFLQELSQIETVSLQQIAPTAGFFTYGEFYHAGETNQLLNATMTVLVLAEKEQIGHLPEKELRPQVFIQKLIDNQDNVIPKNIRVLKTLSHLVNTVTEELVMANEKLTYMSLHDGLTGLYNRAFFEQEMKKLDESEKPVGIIICDIGSLKSINDILGHDFGDRVIRIAAERLTKSCCSNEIIARIGGDEFAILVPNAELGILEEITKQISETVINNNSLEEVLHLSVGCALKGLDNTDNMDEAFRLADQRMYQHKVAALPKVRQRITDILISREDYE